jgi:hypothetical protein
MQALLDKLLPGDAYGAPLALATFHLALSEIDQAAEWTGKAIEQRHPATFFYLNVHGRALRASRWWPDLARRLNLPG